MSWEIDFKAIKPKYAKRFDVFFRKIVIDLFSKVIMRSPVDTGRFRMNWQLGINQTPSGVIEGEDAGSVNQTGSGASVAKDKVISGAGALKTGDTAILVNNLPYAERLEEGYSPQAAGGVIGVSVAEFQNIADKVGVEVKKI